VQLVVISGNPNGGTWTLAFDGAPTDPLIYNVNVSTMLAALEALPTIGPGNVNVAKSGNEYTITFQGALGSRDVSQLVADYSGLNRGEVTVTTTTPGSATRKAATTATSAKKAAATKTTSAKKAAPKK
jgi:trimeric autotransporter adhesin